MLKLHRHRRRRRKHEHAIVVSLLAFAVYRQISLFDNDGISLLHSTTSAHHILNDNDFEKSESEHALLHYMHQQRLALINESSVVNYQRVYDHFENEVKKITMQSAPEPRRVGVGAQCPYENENERIRDEFLKIFTSLPTPTEDELNNSNTRCDILGGQGWGPLCCTMDGFFATGEIKEHVLLSTVDSNWAEFSVYVPNRTQWGDHRDCNGDVDRYYQYLNHSNVRLVVTVQHQHFDHPKVISLPLGQQSNATDALQKQRWHMLSNNSSNYNNRTNLLLINCDASPTRKPILERVIANFNGEIENTYNPGDHDEYFQQLSTSKFILSPSGLGWDCYRTWEALILGCIPILETYYRQDGLYRTYDDLPVLWVDHYDNVTPSLLEREYPKIMSRARKYKFEKLTTQWWVDLINSYRS